MSVSKQNPSVHAGSIKHTILIVEDEPLLLSLVTSILAPEDSFHLLCASSAMEGLRLGTEFSGTIDLLLANVILDGTLGTDLAVKLKKLRPEMRVMLLAGKEDGELAILDKGWKVLDRLHLKEELLQRVRSDLLENSAAFGS